MAGLTNGNPFAGRAIWKGKTEMEEVKSIFYLVQIDGKLYKAVAIYVICGKCQSYLELKEEKLDLKSEWVYQCPYCGEVYFSPFVYPIFKYEPADVISHE